MIKGAILVAALVSAGATSASAETTFIGTIRITAVTPQCQNVQVGYNWSSQFHPLIAGQDDNSEGITFVGGFGGSGYNGGDQPFGSEFRFVQSGGLGWGGVFFRPNNQRAKIGDFTSTPDNITSNTKTLVLKGKIQRYEDDPGGLECVASFTGSYVKDQ